MAYGQSGRFPTDPPDRLHILLTGRQLTATEAERWTRELSGRRKRLPLLVAISTALLLPQLLFGMTSPFRVWYETVALVLLFFGSVVWTVLAWVRALRAPAAQARRQYEEYAADTARHRLGSRIAFYGERLTVTSVRGTQEIRFCDVVLCIETADGFALNDGREWVILRAQDMIAFDAKLVHDYLQERLEARVFHVRGAAMPQLVQPLPIPRLPDEAPCLCQARLAWNKTAYCHRCRRDVWQTILAATLPLWWVLAVVLIEYLPLSPWFLVDMLGYFLVCTVVGCGFTYALFHRIGTRDIEREAVVTFHTEGLSITHKGVTRFFIKERLGLQAETSGVRIWFSDNNRLFVPYSTVDDPSMLKALAGVTETSNH